MEAFRQRKKRASRGRPRGGESPEEETRYRLQGEVETRGQARGEQGWTVLATTVGPAVCSAAEILGAYLEQGTTIEPGVRWIKNPAAITPVWVEQPERIAALAMLTVIGLLVYALIQRPVRRYLQHHDQQVPGNKGLTMTPTGAVVLSLFTPVMMVQLQIDNTAVRQVYGVQEHHWLVCKALDIDRSWYEISTTPENSQRSVIPP